MKEEKKKKATSSLALETIDNVEDLSLAFTPINFLALPWMQLEIWNDTDNKREHTQTFDPTIEETVSIQ